MATTLVMLNGKCWRLLLAVGIGLTAATGAMAAAGIYGYTDDSGVAHFSNVPGDDSYRLILAEPSSSDGQGIRGRRSSGGDALPIQAPFTEEIVSAAHSFALEPALLQAVIAVESNHNPSAQSPKGAMGLMQLMPATAQRFGVTDPWNPTANIRAGAHYLSDLLKMFDNNLVLALAAYNAGEAAVIRYGKRVPPFRETRSYVAKVVAGYRMTPSTTKQITARAAVQTPPQSPEPATAYHARSDSGKEASF